MKCQHCNFSVVGHAYVTASGLFLHRECVAASQRAERGLFHACPQCKQTGRIKDPANAKTVQRQVDAPRDERGHYDCAYGGCRGCGICTTGKVLAMVTEIPDTTCPLCKGEGWLAHKPKPITETKIVGWQ